MSNIEEDIFAKKLDKWRKKWYPYIRFCEGAGAWYLCFKQKSEDSFR